MRRIARPAILAAAPSAAARRSRPSPQGSSRLSRAADARGAGRRQGKLPPSPNACRRRRSSSISRRAGAASGAMAARSGRSSPRRGTCATSPSTRYTRLVGYNEKLELKPESSRRSRTTATASSRSRCAKAIAGPTASPSRPRTSATTGKTSRTTRSSRPSGPPDLFLVDGKLPKVEILDERQVRYSWDKPNPRFLPALALPRADLHLFAGALSQEVPRQVLPTRGSSTSWRQRRS